jgi:hypothetical protein
MFRAQRKLNGLEPEIDNAGVPTGKYRQIDLDADETDKWLKTLTAASDQVQKIEKALGIDKVTREAGGSMSVENYLKTIKRAAHERGIHIVKRTLAYEHFVNDFRWRLRVYFNADAEDRAYHDLTPDKLMAWCKEQLDELEEVDKKFAREKGKLYAGQL